MQYTNTVARKYDLNVVKSDGDFVLTTDKIYYYDDDDVCCDGTVRLYPKHNLSTIEVVLQADMVFRKRNCATEVLHKLFMVRKPLAEINMNSTETQNFQVCLNISMFSPPTVHTRGLFTFNNKVLHINGYVRWMVELVGISKTRTPMTEELTHAEHVDTANEDKIVSLRQVRIHRYSLYEKKSKEITVEGYAYVSISKNLKLHSRRSGKRKAKNSTKVVSEERTINCIHESEERESEISSPLSVPIDSHGESTSSTTHTSGDTGNVKQSSHRQHAATKRALEFMYRAADVTDANADTFISAEHTLHNMNVSDAQELLRIKLKNNLSTDFESTNETGKGKDKLLMRATLHESNTLPNNKPFSVSVSLLNESRVLIARSVDVRLVQSNTFFTSGAKFTQCVTVANEKRKLGLSNQSLFVSKFTLSPNRKKSRVLSNFSSEAYNSSTPAPTSAIRDMDGCSLVNIDYELMIICKVWGGDDIVKIINVDLESRTLVNEEELNTTLRVPRPGLVLNTDGASEDTAVDRYKTAKDIFDIDSPGSISDLPSSSNRNQLLSPISVQCALRRHMSQSTLFDKDSCMYVGRIGIQGNSIQHNSRDVHNCNTSTSLSLARRRASEGNARTVVPELSPVQVQIQHAPLRVCSPRLVKEVVLPEYNELDKKSTKSFGDLQLRRESSVSARKGSVKIAINMDKKRSNAVDEITGVEKHLPFSHNLGNTENDVNVNSGAIDSTIPPTNPDTSEKSEKKSNHGAFRRLSKVIVLPLKKTNNTTSTRLDLDQSTTMNETYNSLHTTPIENHILSPTMHGRGHSIYTPVNMTMNVLRRSDEIIPST
eukprot:CFRG3273T1